MREEGNMNTNMNMNIDEYVGGGGIRGYTSHNTRMNMDTYDINSNSNTHGDMNYDVSSHIMGVMVMTVRTTRKLVDSMEEIAISIMDFLTASSTTYVMTMNPTTLQSVDSTRWWRLPLDTESNNHQNVHMNT